nr:type VI secretion system ATPase TssH [Prolixibacteraceae bacterium]
IGSQHIQQIFDGINENNRYEKYEQARLQVFDLLKKTIRPEFLNRIDDTIMFLPLGRKQIHDIVQLQFERISDRLGQQGLKIDISEAAIDWIASVGYDPQYGARPVKRVLQQYILNDLSKRILAGNIDKNKPIVVDLIDQELVFRN